MELRGRVNMRKSLNRKALSSFPLLTWNIQNDSNEPEGASFTAVYILRLKQNKAALDNKAHTAGLHLSFHSNMSRLAPGIVNPFSRWNAIPLKVTIF